VSLPSTEERKGRPPKIGRDRARARTARWARAVQAPSDVAGRRAQRNRACRARPGANTGADEGGREREWRKEMSGETTKMHECV
jgi:hypothetical protein